MSFEKKLKKIKEISASLESKEISLEKMIKNFGVGVNLINECRQILEETEMKVDILKETNNEENNLESI